MELARPVSQADFEGAMKRVRPSITRGSEVAVSPGEFAKQCVVRRASGQIPTRGEAVSSFFGIQHDVLREHTIASQLWGKSMEPWHQ